MSALVVPLFRLAVASLALAGAVRAPAQLAANSPFLPPQAAGAAGPTAGAPLEYRGFIETPEGVQYRLYDPARKSGEWVKLNQRNSVLDVLAKNYDDSRNTLVVEYQGRTLTLAAREGKVVSSGNAAQAMPPPPPMPVAQPMPAAVTNAVVVNPTPADEQKRLEAVATEVARRRALREQAVQQVGQGTGQAMAPQAQPQRNFPPNQQGPNQQRPNQQNNNRGRAQNPQAR